MQILGTCLRNLATWAQGYPAAADQHCLIYSNAHTCTLPINAHTCTLGVARTKTVCSALIHHCLERDCQLSSAARCSYSGLYSAEIGLDWIGLDWIDLN